MAKGKKKVKPTKGEELLENPQAIAEQLNKTEQFLEQNRKMVLIVGGAIAAVVGLYFLYNYYTSTRNDTAQKELFQAVYYFEADSLDKALNGDGNNYGFLQIIDKYGMTKAANLAHYYVGASYLKKGEYQSAIDHLGKFSSGDLLIQGRAYCLIGDAYMESDDYKSAVKFYEKAADYNANEHTSPAYLIKAAIAYEELKDYKSAYKCYSTIVENYVNSSEYQTARKHKSRLESKAG
jgi:tetratricopeptide (TPR) repeat protein